MRSYPIKNEYIRKTGAAGHVLSRHDLRSRVVLRSCRKKLRFPAASFYTSKTSYCRFGPFSAGKILPRRRSFFNKMVGNRSSIFLRTGLWFGRSRFSIILDTCQFLSNSILYGCSRSDTSGDFNDYVDCQNMGCAE